MTIYAYKYTQALSRLTVFICLERLLWVKNVPKLSQISAEIGFNMCINQLSNAIFPLTWVNCAYDLCTFKA